MTCHGSSHDSSSSALACPMALSAPMSATLGHMPQHGLEKVYKEMMQADSRRVKDRFASTTTWPLAMAMPEEVHGEIVLGGSHDGVGEIGSTTKRPLEATRHVEAHGGVSSKESTRSWEHFCVTTYKVEWQQRRATTATTNSNQIPYRVSHPYIAESLI
ncbi:hypothetical protein CJ030_MR2G022274 [Morella rubra]|uniref:Uncharacterized protein n=1 Tax=Morella rubra TaxID=262757 RepID=A0A6A1WBW3_9ROSI|nr:hypothetical protein CJ030_MR2G022273 [Morella rubra]KAB1222783.1 hypothetical protein CJ030_MR2G022274 [Morella rubra]